MSEAALDESGSKSEPSSDRMEGKGTEIHPRSSVSQCASSFLSNSSAELQICTDVSSTSLGACAFAAEPAGEDADTEDDEEEERLSSVSSAGALVI